MADKKSMMRLDERLVSMGVVSGQFLAELPLVHRKMNSIVKKTGAILSDEVFETGNAELRSWLSLLSKRGATQEKLTAYLRCGLAHLTYDFIESQFHLIGAEDLSSRVIVSLKNRKLHTSFFKPTSEPHAPRVKRNTAAKGKVVAIKKKDMTAKKTPAKKATAKKATAKKATAKKTVAKKPAAKKKAVAKKAVKKPVKKAVAKKAAKKPVKKAAVKKTVAKKPAAKKKAVTKKTAKKAVAKKVAKKPVKKAGAKKSTAKKTIAKKPAAKKVAVRKSAPKKAVAKKPAAKKPASRKPATKRTLTRRTAR